MIMHILCCSCDACKRCWPRCRPRWPDSQTAAYPVQVKETWDLKIFTFVIQFVHKTRSICYAILSCSLRTTGFIVALLSPWKRGDIGLSLSVCLSVCPSVRLSRLMCGTLCTRVGYEGVELELWNFIHVYTEVWSRASLRFHLDRLKIVDSGTLCKLSVFTFSPDVRYMCTRV